MKTAAIYARVSSEKQKDEKTIGSQTRSLIAYGKEHHYVIPQEWIFEDEGYSGNVLVRPGLERIRDLASCGEIGYILVYSPDRLSRKYAYQILLVEEFARQGVEVVFLKSVQGNTPEERLLIQFQGMIAEYERAQIMERSRRGKRHRAQQGKINVLSGAPYGYRYIKKSDHCDAYYEVIPIEAEVVREIYSLYTDEGWSIGKISRHLTTKGIPTRSGKNRWDRSTVWGMLRNPAYKGAACFGKTEQSERQKIARPLRKKGGFSPRCSSSQRRPQEDWIEIPVPPIVSEVTYQLAQERLEENKRLSCRNTKEPTLLQGLLVCQECGYSIYRSSTRTSKRKLYYYRCLGSDNYRHQNGRICSNKPIRQDYLDDLVWKQIIQLLKNPELIRQEIDRRVQSTMNSDPAKNRKKAIVKELIRIQKSIDKLLDAYQENLLGIEELRKRMPLLRKKESTLKNELQGLEARIIAESKFNEIEIKVETFLGHVQKYADKLSLPERQKILRLLVKDIYVSTDTITINHSIPITSKNCTSQENLQSYPLCLRGGISLVG